MATRRCFLCLALVLTLSLVAAGAQLPLAHTVAAMGGAHHTSHPRSLETAPSPRAGALDDPHAIYLPVVQHAYCSWCAVPTLLAPPDGSTVESLMPELHWDSRDDPRATRAWVRIARDPAFDDVVTMAYGSSWAQGAHHYRFSNMRLAPGTTYWWRVQLQYPEVWGPPSPTWSFTTPTDAVVPPAPQLLAPPNGTVLTTLPVTLQWAPVEGALEYWLHWKVQGPGGHTSIPVEGTEARLGGFEPATTYEWWVLTRNQYAVSDPSEVWTFTTP